MACCLSRLRGGHLANPEAALACLSLKGAKGRSRGISRASEYYRSSTAGVGPRNGGGAALSGRAQASRRQDSAAREESFRRDFADPDYGAGVKTGFNNSNVARTLRGRGWKKSLFLAIDKKTELSYPTRGILFVTYT